MINIKRFIDRIALAENKHNKDFVISLAEAKAVRDELAKLLVDLHNTNYSKKEIPDQEKIIKLEIKGRSFNE